MAASNGRKKTTSRKRSNSGPNAKISTKRTYNRRKSDVDDQTSLLKKEITIWITIAFGIILMLFNFGVGKTIGNFIAGIFFGICGLWNYVFPFFLVFLVVFFMVNKGNMSAYLKFGAFIIASFMVCTFIELLSGPFDPGLTLGDYYRESSVYKNGGGFIGGAFTKLLCTGLGKAIAFVIVIIVFIICVVIISEKSILKGIRNGSQKAYSHAKDNARVKSELRREERENRLKLKQYEEEARYHDRINNSYNGSIDDSYEETYDERYVDSYNELNEETYDESIKIPFEEPYVDSFYSENEDDSYTDSFEPVFDKRSQHDDDFIRDISKETGSNKNFFFSLEKNYQHELERENAFLEDKIDSETKNDDRYNDLKPENSNSEDLMSDDKNAQELNNDDFTFFDLSNKDFYDLNGYIEPGQFVVNNSDDDVPDKKIDISSDRKFDFSDVPELDNDSDDLIESAPRHTVSAPLKKGSASTKSVSFASKNTAVSSANTKEDIVSSRSSVVNRSSVSKNIDSKPEFKEYRFPSVDLLERPKNSGKGISQRSLQETADKLQKTLESFGVMTHVVNVSCGPSVTRYELAPETGIKVSRIVNLADDIKLNLAASDIRIEAPIPGKSAVGIEVPNSENKTVTLRELIESDTFDSFNSKIAFAVGLDLSGRSVVADIYKMPHLLIGGATGSGKSVCINTLIISILYKARPDEVKFIMIDPKMIELNLYNGIPHLIIPVVTDPRKAAGALQWAVSEMTRRYTLFAALGVRDLKSYNKKIETVKPDENGIPYEKLPQIVIVVDEFADLMMVAKGNVEDSVCRLAQLARAAGIHLILATQRPSVDVITGIIKNNLPSRIALAVTSGVDSRTIIDMVGAEKLLGKGDMLFYPSGYPKPVRVQGAYVSEEEVERVVEFVKNQNGDADYDNNVASQVEANANSSSKDNSKSNGNMNNAQAAYDTAQIVEDDGRDVYFQDAARFIVEKEKASIGSLQRVFKIGFNRAARIMDQLCEAGIVGEEEGTKPRKILMNMNQLEEFLNPDYENIDFDVEGEEE